MTISQSNLRRADQMPVRDVAAARPARAYCGPAHGVLWDLPVDGELPEVVELAGPAGVSWYRLVHHPRAGGPSRDYHGRYQYVPYLEAGKRAGLV